MTQVCENNELADMILMYGECRKNSRTATRSYSENIEYIVVQKYWQIDSGKNILSQRKNSENQKNSPYRI